jgi:hypothetical protein
MCPGPGCDHSSRARFQWTTCHPPVPKPSETAVVLSTTRSPVATGPVSSVRAYARPASVATRANPGRSLRISVTVEVTKRGMARRR